VKRIVSLSVSLLLTLLLAAGLFSVTALAATVMPTSYALQTSEKTTTGDGDIYMTEIPFTIEGEDTLVTLDGPWELTSAEVETIPFGTGTFMATAQPAGDYLLPLYVEADDLNVPDSTYSCELEWHDDHGNSGTITISITIAPDAGDSSEESSEESSEPEESSEESSEPEESSEESSEPEEESSTTEESSTAEDESSATEDESSTTEDESSAAESESESSQSSKTSKPQNPGKPDTLTMGGSTGGTADSGKPAPDTGMSYAPLAALGLIAISALAVLAFRKK